MWIKCSERLPTTGMKVLVSLINSHNKRRTRIGFYTEGNEIDYDNEECPEMLCNACENGTTHYLEQGWYQEIDDHGTCNGTYDSFNITHWQPLPEPPKEDE